MYWCIDQRGECSVYWCDGQIEEKWSVFWCDGQRRGVQCIGVMVRQEMCSVYWCDG